MRLLITGASGFLGRFVIDEAVRRGHEVRAVVRPAGRPIERRGVEQVMLDLRSPAGLVDALAGVDAVLHLAASKSGDMYAQYAGTVVSTENLLSAMVTAGVKRIVHVSSFSVYEYLHKRSYTLLDEGSRLEAEFPPRDEYSHTKLVQERLVRECAEEHGWDYAVLRPGVIYGPENIWTARLGISSNPRRWVRVGSLARLPLAYVENCAEAIVMASEKPGAMSLIANVVDDDCPTQARYIREARRRMAPPPRTLTIPWPLVRLVARTALLTNTVLFKGRAKLPEFLVPAKLHARFKPLRYSNRRLRESLGWRPRYTLLEALDRSLGRHPDAARHLPAQSVVAPTAAAEPST